LDLMMLGLISMAADSCMRLSQCDFAPNIHLA
jgi:hypothetical protein